MTLTIKAVEAARAAEKPYKITDAKGLYLYISTAGGKSWRSNYKHEGKQATKTYGTYPTLSLAQARADHAAFQALVKNPKKPTFQMVATNWLKVKLPTLSNKKHQIQVSETLERHVYPMIGDKPVDTLKRVDFVAVARSIEALNIIETAHRVAGRIEKVMDYAVDEGLIESHSAAKLSRVIVARSKATPMPSIPPAEAPALLRAIDTYDEPVTRLGLLLLAHTFVRTGELRGMRWSEINRADAVWVVPAERMKGKPHLRKPHVVPLTPYVLDLLDELAKYTGASDLAMESPLRPGHPISENTLLFALYRLGYRGRMTGHGFRALASTVLNQQSDFDKDVIEKQLAHNETDEVRAAYNRAMYLPQRRELVAWWSAWLQAQHAAPQ